MVSRTNLRSDAVISRRAPGARAERVRREVAESSAQAARAGAALRTDRTKVSSYAVFSSVYRSLILSCFRMYSAQQQRHPCQARGAALLRALASDPTRGRKQHKIQQKQGAEGRTHGDLQRDREPVGGPGGERALPRARVGGEVDGDGLGRESDETVPEPEEVPPARVGLFAVGEKNDRHGAAPSAAALRGRNTPRHQNGRREAGAIGDSYLTILLENLLKCRATSSGSTVEKDSSSRIVEIATSSPQQPTASELSSMSPPLPAPFPPPFPIVREGAPKAAAAAAAKAWRLRRDESTRGSGD